METNLLSHEFDSQVLGFPASLHWHGDHGPVRPITTTRHSRPVGRYFSVKNGRALPWESRNELRALYHAEVSSDVVNYWVQPHKLKMVVGSKVCVYTPDREELLADGSRRILEVKDQFKADSDPLYTQKLDHARAVYQLSGKLYRIQERAEIEAQPLFDSVEAIQSFRRTVVTPHDVMLVQQTFSTHDVMPLSVVRDVFKSSPLGFAKICAMIVRRMLTIDLVTPISARTPIRILYRH